VSAIVAIAKENEYGKKNATYAIGWGDLPYSDLQATVGVPNLIADMNSHKPSLHRPQWRPQGRQYTQLGHADHL